MKTYNKKTIKRLFAFFFIFQINSIVAHTIFVVGPGENKNWHKSLTKISNNLEKQYSHLKESFEIFPEINIKNKQGISDYYNGNLDKLSELLAEKIIQNFMSLNFKSIEAIKKKLETKNQIQEKLKDKTKHETKDKIEREKISLISYGKGAFVLVNALYKLKQKLEKQTDKDQVLMYFLEDIIAMDEISGYQKPALQQMVQSQSIYSGMQNLAVYSDEESSGDDRENENNSEYSNSSSEYYSDSENENNDIITIDLSEQIEKQLTYEQMLLLQGKIEDINQSQSQQLEILKLISQLKEGPDLKKSKSKLKLVLKICAATGAVCTTVVSVTEAVGAVVGVIGTIIVLTA